MAESSGWSVETADAGLGLSRYFTRLVGNARPGPVLGVFVDGVPHEVLEEEFGCCPSRWMSEVVDGVEAFLPKCLRNPRPGSGC